MDSFQTILSLLGRSAQHIYQNKSGTHETHKRRTFFGILSL